MFEIPRRKLLGMTMAVFGFFTTLSSLPFPVHTIIRADRQKPGPMPLRKGQ
jgi:hypothetical protein